MFGPPKKNLTPPLFIEVPVPSQKGNNLISLLFAFLSGFCVFCLRVSFTLHPGYTNMYIYHRYSSSALDCIEVRVTLSLFFLCSVSLTIVWRFVFFSVEYDVYIHQQMSLCGRDVDLIRLFRIMSIPTTFRLVFVLTSEQIGRRLSVFTLSLWNITNNEQ
jgi:hypothetical protein